MTCMPNVNELLNRLSKVEPHIAELRRRYGECDESDEGHVAPNQKDNRCLHCYRRLAYRNHTGNARDYNREAEIEKVSDYFTGLRKLRGK